MERMKVLVAGATGALGLPLVRLLAPPATALAGSRIPVSAALARRDLGWRPQFLDYHEGLKQVARELGQAPSSRAVENPSLRQPSQSGS